jgi:hypothetical protein
VEVNESDAQVLGLAAHLVAVFAASDTSVGDITISIEPGALPEFECPQKLTWRDADEGKCIF